MASLVSAPTAVHATSRLVVSARSAPPTASLAPPSTSFPRRRRQPTSQSASLSCKRSSFSSSHTLVVRASSEDGTASETAAPELAAALAAAAAPSTDGSPAGDAPKIAAVVSEIKDYLKLLYVKREMNFNEVRLTLAIEDPRLADRRERYGIEDESGVSADEKCAALETIDAGEMPEDLLACEKLLEDFRAWPGLEEDVAAAARKASGPSRYAAIANQAAGIRGGAEGQRRAEEQQALEEEEDKPEMDGNPFGFLVLYGVSAVPIFITIAALSIMFVNSLQ
uniref:Uncharacterized protein n=1 Tax=Mantoniella antarctica TaxID=81844 RepID=A0A7S0SLR8_9CHLO